MSVSDSCLSWKLKLNLPASEGVVALGAAERFDSTIFALLAQSGTGERREAHECVHDVAGAPIARRGVGNAGIGSVSPSSPSMVLVQYECPSPLHGRQG
jgi:hypothetical protein